MNATRRAPLQDDPEVATLRLALAAVAMHALVTSGHCLVDGARRLDVDATADLAMRQADALLARIENKGA